MASGGKAEMGRDALADIGEGLARADIASAYAWSICQDGHALAEAGAVDEKVLFYSVLLSVLFCCVICFILRRCCFILFCCLFYSVLLFVLF